MNQLIPRPQTGHLHTLKRWFVATRPAFLSVTLVAVLIGFASALHDGYAIAPIPALLTLLFALVAHAGANVLNDYYDALNGCDFAESDRIFPFTGGSRMIQNGVMTPRAVGILGAALLLSVIPAGLWLTLHSARGLLHIGLLGLVLAWGYSAPPFKLQSRGLGEFGITASWLLVVVGANYVLSQHFNFTPIASGSGLALLVANVLFINQFPDIRADRSAGKGTLVVRLGARQARWGYPLIAVLSYGWVVCMVALQQLPVWALVSLIPAVLSTKASLFLLRHAEQPTLLTPAIQWTIGAALVHGALMAVSLFFA